MAPTVIFWQDEITLTAPQRAQVGAYATAAFPAAVPAAMTTLGISRTGPGPSVRAVLWEEGTITPAQFLALKQAGQNVTVTGVSGSDVNVVRRTDGSGVVPPPDPEDPGDEGGDLSQLRTLVQSIFGLSATDTQNVHSVQFKRPVGGGDTTARVWWRQVVTAQEWVDGIAAGLCATSLYPHEIEA